MNLNLERRTLHFRKPAATSRGLLRERTLWLVRACEPARESVCGLGECGPIPGLSRDDVPDFEARARTAVEAITQVEVAIPRPATLEDVATALAPFDDLLRPLPSLRFGLETAILDLTRGGNGVLWDSPFSHGDAGLPTHGLIWMDTPDGILSQIDAKVAAGFNVIKMKVGGLDWPAELALLATVRARYPNIVLRLDANGAFAEESALEKLAQLAALNVHFLEQPLRAGLVEATARLCRASPIPLALDEELIEVATPAQALSLVETVRPSHLILKPALLGGFAACHALIAACQRLGIEWWVNSLLESSIGHHAICQWTAAFGEGRVHGLGTGSLYADNFPSRIALKGSELHCDSGPIAH